MATWDDRYYADYAKQIAAAGGTPVSQEEWSDNITENNLDTTAKNFLSSELNKIKTVNDTANQKTISDQAAADTIAKNQALGQTLIGTVQGQQQTSEADLLKALSAQGDQEFSLSQPGILEDLSSRDLLHSSGVGTALAKEKGDIQTGIANAMMAKQTNDASDITSIEKTIMENASGVNTTDFTNDLNLEQSGLARQYSLEDYMNSANQASDLAQQANDAAEKQSENALLGDVIQGATAAVTGGVLQPKTQAQK